MKSNAVKISGRISGIARLGVIVVMLTICAVEAQAIVGMPLTPVSYAGVARRTVRSAAVYGSLGVGSTVATLPAGNVTITSSASIITR